ncbi:GNAT family N-acetyltransferase [Micromonospora sp. NPDC049044]|uniref:GNAT family N-acetyltransferase n=1 Tax=unclassified Micromonospora TaxID=2617518 RepID=UPI0033CB9747
MLIREFVDQDWSQVWPITEEVIRAQETFTYDPAMTAEQSYAIWVEAAPGRTVVAVEGGRVFGTALCRDALAWARHQGYAGMQFNAVAQSNRSAVELYRREGFTVIGTVPGAFRHPTLGRVGLHVMYQEF